jgi:Tol biopolymer transport system component
MLPDCEEAVACLSFGDISFTYGDDNKIIIDNDEWKQLIAATAGNSKGIKVEVYGKKDDKWLSYKEFPIYVAKDTIDPYIAYRLIEPSYITYEDISIVQRNITNFEESDIYNNQLIQKDEKGQCINCHSFQNYGTNNMLFHMRQFNGGTMLVHNGTPKKLDLKTDSTISAGVYPSWHPTADLVAFSTNTTRQTFHTKDKDKIEVLDYASDLILYDVAKNEVSTISNAKDELECFPTWSPDGKTLYYTSAHISSPDSISTENYFKRHFREIKYNIYSRSFDLATHKFGEPQLVFDAASLNKSATLPRVSPDGKYITFALGSYGCFHVWHRDADICVIETPQPLPSTSTLNSKPSTLNTTPLNSPFSESYPSFSSNGRWIMTASRRDDGNYTRPYISYFDANGKCHKAFEIPQQDPERNTLLLRSYNRPEFMKQRVKVTPQQFATKAQENAVHAKYIKK